MNDKPARVWMVRYHLNKFASFPHRDVYVVARDRAQALTLAAMTTVWTVQRAENVKRATASVTGPKALSSRRGSRPIRSAKWSGLIVGPPLVHEG